MRVDAEEVYASMLITYPYPSLTNTAMRTYLRIRLQYNMNIKYY